jgi:heavy metal translocating P-type ATPase
VNCTLCGLDSHNSDFCCAGCRNVYTILVESGVLASGGNFRETELFQRSLRLGLISNPIAGSEPMPQTTAEVREAVFQLSGMWCSSCAWLIEHALARTRGVVSAEVIFTSDLLKVCYAPQQLPVERMVERITSLGYRAEEYTGQNGGTDAERKDLLLRTGIAAFLSLNVMTFSLVVYTSYFEHIAASFSRFMPFVLMALATPSVFYCAFPVLRIAWAGARHGVLRMESLLAMGILAAYGYSAAVAFCGGTHVYFDTACAIVTLVLAGKAIERGAKARTARAVTLLYRLMPSKARLVSDGRERFVSLGALRPGTLFLVKSGERIPADGIVADGRSHVDESVLTGESAPQSKGPGDTVVCGSVNNGGVLEIRATRVGAESTLARIVRSVEQAVASRTAVERAVDNVSRWFIPAVLAIAILTFAGWLGRTGSAAEALMHALAVIVIACPCALGIATPLALNAAVAAAGRRGILVSDMRVLETICGVDTVVLDKTGTATTGRFSVIEKTGDLSRLAELAAVESRSEHPIGKALVSHLGMAGRLPEAQDFVIHAGMGISGVVNGVRYFLGNRQMAGMREDQPGPHTTVFFGWDDAVKGTLVFGDQVRPDAAELCAALRSRGVRSLLLSGDSPGATEFTARAIGADEWAGGAGPERKVEIIREMQRAGKKVAMIGDGVNDAPSLAQADLGIALGTGADIAMQAAPLVLMNGRLHLVTDTLDLARHAFRIVRLNLFWAFFYNAGGITLAIAGVLNPILAAGAMVLSSLSVIGNSRRLSRF